MNDFKHFKSLFISSVILWIGINYFHWIKHDDFDLFLILITPIISLLLTLFSGSIRNSALLKDIGENNMLNEYLVSFMVVAITCAAFMFFGKCGCNHNDEYDYVDYMIDRIP